VWVWQVANQRVHGTTHEQVTARWGAEQQSLQPLNGRQPYPYADDELRKVARDAYVSWQGSRYSVPWQYVGQQVWAHSEGGRKYAENSAGNSFNVSRGRCDFVRGRKHLFMAPVKHLLELL
jgi:hypothetical protein